MLFPASVLFLWQPVAIWAVWYSKLYFYLNVAENASTTAKSSNNSLPVTKLSCFKGCFIDVKIGTNFEMQMSVQNADT